MTFSKQVKQEISSLSPKIKNCCAYSFLYGMTFPCVPGEDSYKVKTTFAENAKDLNDKMKSLLFKIENGYVVERGKILINKGIVRYSTIAEIAKNVFRCSRCKEHFIRGLFFSCGTISSPEKDHRLDLNFANMDHAYETLNYFLDNSLKFNVTKRNDKTVLYIKRSEVIDDFLAMMGANNSAFEMINSKIEHEVRNVANRATNCDSANINKSLNATKRIINIINEIRNLGAFDDLPKPLKEIANVRLEYPDINISELGKRLTPPISKSGVHHRLEKIVKYYENLK